MGHSKVTFNFLADCGMGLMVLVIELCSSCVLFFLVFYFIWLGRPRRVHWSAHYEIWFFFFWIWIFIDWNLFCRSWVEFDGWEVVFGRWHTVGELDRYKKFFGSSGVFPRVLWGVSGGFRFIDARYSNYYHLEKKLLLFFWNLNPRLK